MVTISTDNSSDGCAGADASGPEQSVSHWAAGGGVGGHCVVPPSPSAKAVADIETTRRQAAKNRLRFVIVLFVLFVEESLA